MTFKMIQIKSSEPYNFNVNINGSNLRVHIRYNVHLNRYYLNVDRQEKGLFVNIASSIMLYSGFNLFMQHPQFNLGELYLIPLKSELYHQDPSAENITDYMLYWKSEN